MIINITSLDIDFTKAFEISDEFPVMTLKSLIDAEEGIPISNQKLFHKNELLRDDSQIIKDTKIKNGDIILLKIEKTTLNNDIAKSVLESNSTDVINKLPNLSQSTISYLKALELFSPANDPLNIQNQKLLEERIRNEQLDESFHLATEYLPEAFGEVFMVFVNMEVNGIPIKAFIDSGAQTTIMSKSCAERCNLTRLIDKRFQGIVQGVGTSHIIGKVHVMQVKIGNSFILASVTIIENNGVDFLFGLDMLRRHNCCLDFKRNSLRFGDEEVPFLSDTECRNETSKNLLRDLHENTSRNPRVIPDEEKISSLIELGFDRESSLNALSRANNDVQYAAMLLIQQRIKPQDF